MTTDLVSLTSQLGREYKAWKTAERSKDKLKGEFFGALDDTIKDDLSETLATVAAQDEDAARAQLERDYPFHAIDAIQSNGAGEWEAILIERADRRAYAYVNPEDGMAYSRVVQQGAALVDDEALQAEDPELYRRVTTVPYETWLRNVLHDEDALAVALSLPGAPERQIRDLDSLEPADLAALQRYIYRAPPTVKLAAPRKAKPEELERDHLHDL